ncbi:MAG: ferredoxin [Actinomycetota bacterium]
MSVRLTVDRDVCIGVGQCELLEPDVFRLDDDEELAEVIGEGALPRDRAEAIVDRCPSGAIAIVGEE